MDSLTNSFNGFFGLGGNKDGRGQNRANGQGANGGQRPNTAQNYGRGRQGDAYNQQANAQWAGPLEEFEKMLIEMGMSDVYTRQQMLYALQATGGAQDKALDYLLNQASQVQAQPQQDGHGGAAARPHAQADYSPGIGDEIGRQGDSSEFAQMQQVLHQQQQDLFQQHYQNRKASNYEPLPVNERARASETPSGLKNIGNTCYFSSLVQTLFFLPNIQEKILNHDASQVADPPEPKLNQMQGDANGKEGEENDTKLERAKLIASKEVVANMQALFAEMLQSNRKYADPTRVLEAIVDNNGAKLTIYEQKDIGEFFQIFLERLQDGLGENKAMVRKLMGDDLVADLARQNSLKGGANGSGDLIDLGSPAKVDSDSGKVPESTGDSEFDFGGSQVSINGAGPAAPGQNPFSQKVEVDAHNMQSMMDPTKQTQLMNYDLDTFKNSIWENFIGSQVQVSLLYEPDGTSKVTNQNIDKMGPVQLQINEGCNKLYQSWEASRKSEVEGFKGDKDGQRKVLETWICRPPNVMMFQLNRVNYDYKNQKLVKDNSRFEFDKTIYLDLFLNQNKEAAYKHYERLDQMKHDHQILKDTYEQYTKTQHPDHSERSKLIDVLSTAESYLQTGSSKAPSDSQSLKNSVVVDNETVDFFDPVQLSQSEFGVSMQEIQIACSVLNKFRAAASSQQSILEKKIQDMERILDKPYVEGGKQPYFLHSIMIHDGLAENGHYYTYVYDRVIKQWWKLDDHRVSISDEETVMKEALGGDGYKSACNLFYISKKVADMIDLHSVPIFEIERAKKFEIPKEIIRSIQDNNLAYQLELQKFEGEQRVKEIMKLFQGRMSELEEKSSGLGQLAELKIFSFFYYLKSVKLRGYGKWTVLAQCVKEKHPAGLSLNDIIKSKSCKNDDVYLGLLSNFSENFLNLTPAEDAALLTRQCEFKDLQKKAILLTHLVMNLSVRALKSQLQTIKFYQAFIKDLQAKHEQNYTQRLQDWDQYGHEILQIFMLSLMISMTLNFKDEFLKERQEAFKCMRLLAVMAAQFTSSRKHIYRQFDTLFSSVCGHYHKLAAAAPAEVDPKDPNAVTKQECDAVLALFQKFRSGQFAQEEMIIISDSTQEVPPQVQEQMDKVDASDAYVHLDGVDPESPSYQFFNSLNEFRISNRVEIQLHETITKRSEPCTEQQFIRLLQDLKMDKAQYKKRKMFDDDFDIDTLFGQDEPLIKV